MNVDKVKNSLDFLKRLSEELSSQNTCATADPRYWVIVEKRKKIQLCDSLMLEYQPLVLCVEDDCKCGYAIINNESGWLYCTVDEFVEHVKEDIFDEDYDREIDDEFYRRVNGDLYEAYEVIDEYIKSFDIHEWYSYVFYEEEWVENDFSGAFLTLSEAQKHLENNRHHYSEGAHPYCKCAYRNYQLEELLNVIRDTPWDEVSEQLDDETTLTHTEIHSRV